ncbi:hypothetical protein [Sphingomonas sp.]|uniref:hypothetical protein n=1 Tax=Sphingomonas sp. TaxID=28214 RepID=UPI0035A8CB73
MLPDEPPSLQEDSSIIASDTMPILSSFRIRAPLHLQYEEKTVTSQTFFETQNLSVAKKCGRVAKITTGAG